MRGAERKAKAMRRIPLLWLVLLIACNAAERPTAPLSYRIVEKEDLGGGLRYKFRVSLPAHYQQKQVEAIAREIIGSVSSRCNEVIIFFFGPLWDTRAFYDVARVVWNRRPEKFEIDYKPPVVGELPSGLKLSSKRGLLGAPIPAGAVLIGKRSATADTDAREEYRLKVSPNEILGFFDREMIRDDWKATGVPSNDSRSFAKGSARILVVTTREGGFRVVGHP